ncbi:MAG: hypothetical protein V3W34_01175, partial [Phycisphaerae bacterium]
DGLADASTGAPSPLGVGDGLADAGTGAPSPLGVGDGLAQERIDRTESVPHAWKAWGTRLGVLAAAASIALVFTLWPAAESRSFDAEIALFAGVAYNHVSHPVTRGEGGSSAEDARSTPPWLAQVLADQRAQAAIADQRDNENMIRLELNDGRLTLDAQSRLAVAPTIDEAAARAEGLFDLIARDQDATDRIVDALTRALPDVSESNRRRLKEALNRWRATNVFGI